VESYISLSPNELAAGFEAWAAARLEQSCADLARRWIISDSHADPAIEAAARLLRRTADFVRDDDAVELLNVGVVARDMSVLGHMPAGHGTAEMLQLMERLARVLDAACLEWIDDFAGSAAPESVLRVAGRLNRAPLLLAEVGLHSSNGGADAGKVKLRQFADMVSHELNTPLNAAVVTAQLLEYTDGAMRSPEARRLVTLIRRNLARADAVLRDVRTAALTPEERMETRTRAFGQVLGESLAEVHDEIVREGVRLEVEEPVADVIVDAARVKLILVNLIRNAARYSDPERKTRWVRVNCSRNAMQDRWWVHVSDNGLGIPAEQHDNIFQRHFRAHPERGNGTGLGLMIVREEVEQLGAEIEFSSEPGVGSTFRFSLPPAQPSE
jgi:signal transduction histidine kinase